MRGSYGRKALSDLPKLHGSETHRVTYHPSKPLFDSSESESQTPITEEYIMKVLLITLNLLLFALNLVLCIGNIANANSVVAAFNAFAAGVCFMASISVAISD